MRRPHYYILYGKEPVPIPDNELLLWARWFENADRTVDRTEVFDDLVSTVFLGLDHQWGNGPPILFETLVFPEQDEMIRYTSWDLAQAGHNVVVSRLEQELQSRSCRVVAIVTLVLSILTLLLSIAH